MATQTWQTERDKLMAGDPNLSLIEATRQARWMTAPTPVQNAPVAWVPPAPTPTQAPTTSHTEAINKQQLADNKAKRQEMISKGEIPAVWTKAPTPVAPTPTPAPTPVAPVETVPTPVKETPVATDTTAQDQAKIQAESQAKMEQEKLKADLALKTEQQKAQESIPTTSTDIYNALVSGQSVAPQKTGAFREAQFKYSLYKRYNAMTPSQLVTSIKNGQIGSELSSMLAQSPNYIQAKQQYEQEKKVEDVNSSIRNIYNSSNNIVEEEEDPFVKITNDIIKEFGYDQDQTALSAFQQYVENDPAIKQYTTALSGTNQQIYDTQTLLNDAVKDFSKQKGDMPVSSFVIASENKFSTLNDTLSNLKALKDVQKADLTMATQMANAKYQAVSQDIQQANTQKNSVISQLIQAQFSMATKKAEADMAKEVAKEAMNDPYVAIPQLVAQYQELWIPFTRSVQQIIADFEGSWQDLGTFLTGLQKTIQSKPEYQTIHAQNMAKWTQYQTFGDKVYKLNPDGTLTPTNISTKSTTPDWKQDASGNWYDANSSISPYSQTSGTPQWLLDYISASEGTNGNYNAMYGKWGQTDINLEWMTIAQIQDLQRGSIYKDKNGNWVGGAMGKYQIVSGTLQGLINRGVVKPTDMFDEATQDKMAMALIGNSYADYKAGKITADQLQNKVSGIWAWVPNTKWVSTYASDGTNKAKADNGAFLQAIGWVQGGWAQTINSSALPLYRKYVEEWILPSKDALKWLWMTSEQFAENANSGYSAYLASKEQEINSTYPTLNIQFTPSYATISATQREKLNESMTKIGDIDRRLERLKTLFNESWTEALPTKTKAEMNSLRQQIILKAKEVENLGVLNWPDLWILESILPETTGIMSGLFSFDSNTLAKINSVQSWYRSDAQTKWINYGARITFKWGNTQPTWQTNTGAWTNYGWINLPSIPNPAWLNLP